MAQITLSPTIAAIVASDTPSLAAVRLLRCIAEQSAHVYKALADLSAKRQSSKGSVRQVVLAYALDCSADAEDFLESVSKPYSKALLGMVYAAVDMHDEAMECFSAVADEMPGARAELIRTMIAAGNLDVAERELASLEESDRPHSLLGGLIHEQRNEIERAINCFEAAIEEEEYSIEAIFHLGVLLDRIGDDDMAMEQYLACADADPSFIPGVLNLGILYEERGESNAAIDCFRQVLAHNPDSRRAKLLMRDSAASRTMYYDEKEERDREQMQKILKTSVNDFELSVRSRNCLAKMNIFTLGDLISITEHEMLNYKNFGETSLKEVREMLDARGLRLGMLREDDDIVPSKSDQKMLVEPIEKLELTPHAAQVMENAGAKRIGDIVQFSDLELYRLPGSGQSVVQEIYTALGAFGLRLSRPEIR